MHVEVSEICSVSLLIFIIDQWHRFGPVETALTVHSNTLAVRSLWWLAAAGLNPLMMIACSSITLGRMVRAARKSILVTALQATSHPVRLFWKVWNMFSFYIPIIFINGIVTPPPNWENVTTHKSPWNIWLMTLLKSKVCSSLPEFLMQT